MCGFQGGFPLCVKMMNTVTRQVHLCTQIPDPDPDPDPDPGPFRIEALLVPPQLLEHTYSVLTALCL